MTVGSRADLILAGENPLEDLSTLAPPLGVMTAGRWYSADELAALLAEVSRAYDCTASESACNSSP